MRRVICYRCRTLEAVPTQRAVLDRRSSTTSGLHTGYVCVCVCVKPAFHDTDILADILARMVADASDTRAIDFLKKLNGEVARHADILATILPRISVSWNAGFITHATVRS